MRESEYSHKKEIYGFLAQKLLISAGERREVLFFWIDLLIQEFEQKYSTHFDSEDKAEARRAIEDWYYSSLRKLIHDINITDAPAGATRIKKVVLFRAKHILREILHDMQEERKGKERKRKERRGKRKKEEKEPAFSFRTEKRRILSVDPDKQEYMFPDYELDGEGVYLRRELVGELMKNYGTESMEELVCILVRENELKSCKAVEDYVATLRNKESSLASLSSIEEQI